MHAHHLGSAGGFGTKDLHFSAVHITCSTYTGGMPTCIFHIEFIKCDMSWEH